MGQSSPILVLPPRYTDDSISMWRAAIQAGWQTQRLMSWRPPPELRMERVVLYGEPLFAAVVADELGIALVEPTLDWVASIPEIYRRRCIEFSTLGQARSLSEPSFVKPADDKRFVSQVYSSGSELPSQDVLDGSIPVMIAEPVDWTVEYRCFVLERQVATLSPYLRDGEIAKADDGTWPASPEELAAANEFAVQVLADKAVAIPPATVLDIGIIRDRGWAVVEANAAWGSGLCACNPKEVLKVLERACLLQDSVTEANSRWIRSAE